MSVDPYQALGVGRDATPDQIKSAYRRLARQLHPDANPGDPSAEARFKEVAVAYEILSDPARKQQYDMFGTATGPGAGGSPFGATGGLGDLFDMFFGGTSPFGGGGGGSVRSSQGSDVEVAIELSFEESVLGTDATVSLRTPAPCEACEATGSADRSPAARCPDCGGAGQVRRVRQSILGQVVTAGVCPTCAGAGSTVSNACPSCRGEGRRNAARDLTIEVPPGVDTGTTLRLAGRGAAGLRGGRAGDLYVHVRVRPHEHLERDGFDLLDELHIPITQAALGASVSISTLESEEQIEVPRGTQTGKVFRLRGRGVPHLDGRGRGDLLVHVVVDTPEASSAEEEELLRQLAELRGEDVAPPDQGLLARLRTALK